MPEYNPIEQAFNKITQYVRNKENNTVTLLKKNINDAIKTITVNDLTNFYKHSLNF